VVTEWTAGRHPRGTLSIRHVSDRHATPRVAGVLQRFEVKMPAFRYAPAMGRMGRAQLDALVEEATVDCYNEDEQVTGAATSPQRRSGADGLDPFRLQNFA
jgi:hypothetical protein